MEPPPLPSPDASPAALDRHRAESLLHELAADLRRLPVDERTRPFHLRALAAKGALSAWTDDESPGAAAARQRMIDAVLRMHAEVRAYASLSSRIAAPRFWSIGAFSHAT
jgi:hypothetical protein